ncbi:MAG TPA: hypothetical protein VLG49_02660 [Rhabdochlamydiaceae bacterium]|nr:hypothetical protein [Rhabdochlamydiaceae bacterium]
MPAREHLTNEKLKGLFKSNFDLANHAIRLARHYIKAGHEVTLDSLLNEVQKHPHDEHFKDLEKMEASEE